MSDKRRFAEEILKEQKNNYFGNTSLRRERGPRTDEFNTFFFAEKIIYNKFIGNFSYMEERHVKASFKAFYATLKSNPAFHSVYERLTDANMSKAKSENATIVSYMVAQFALVCKALNLEMQRSLSDLKSKPI